MMFRAVSVLWAGAAWLAAAGAAARAPTAGDQVVIVTTSGVGAYDEALEGAQKILSAQSPYVVDLGQKDSPKILEEALRLKTVRVVLTIGSEATDRAVGLAGPARIIAAATTSRDPALTLVPVYVPLPPLLENLRHVFPDKLRLGVIRNTSEVHPRVTTITSAAESAGYTVHIGECTGPAQLLQTLTSLKDRCDLVLCLPDATLYNSATVKPLVLASLRYRLPLIGFTESFVRAGAAAGVYPDFRDLGAQAGELALKALSGQTLPRMEHPRRLRVAVNQNITRLLGLSYTQPPNLPFLVIR